MIGACLEFMACGRLHRWVRQIGRMVGLWATSLMLVACTGLTGDDSEDLQDDDLKLKPSWHEFLGAVSRDRPMYNALVNGPAKRQVPAMLQTPELYEGGVFGYLGSAKAFVAPRRTIPDYPRLYWVMVKVLSEKYYCFITAKQNRGDETWIQCRDGRQVVFWRDMSPKWIQFQARQFDREGYEIAVRHHQIVRIGNVASAVGPIGEVKVN